MKCSSTWFAAVLDMPSRHVGIWSRRSCFHCWARSRGDQNNIIVALGIREQLGLKGESERFDAFTRMNLFLEEM